jgi:hypothetical protein
MTDTVQSSLRLHVDSGPHVGEECCISALEARVGRGSENDLCLFDDQTVSEEHVRFYVEDNRWYVADSGSRNGVFIPGAGGLERLSGPTSLADKSEIHLGSTRLSVSIFRQPSNLSSPEDPTVEPVRHSLQIRHEPGRLSYLFGESVPLSRVYSTDYSPERVDAAVKRIHEVMALSNLGPEHGIRATAALQEIGEHLAEQLVPPRVREKMAAMESGSLLITHDSELLHVPWEWIRHGGNAWCECLDLGRQVVSEHVSIRLPERREKGRKTLLIALNPTSDLDAAQGECEVLLQHFSRHEDWLDVVLIAGSRVTVDRMLEEMERADMVYFLGHGHYDAALPERSGWLLADGPITTAHLDALRCPPWLIFSNACDTAREAPQDKASHGYAGNMGMASRFLFVGVEAYVGALWPIHVDTGAAFARLFFQHFLEGKAIGGAVRETRQEMQEACGDEDPVWASYVLYGDPLLKAGKPSV